MFDRQNFPGAKKYWLNGRIEDWDQAQVHVMSHVLHYGSSIFEGLRAYLTDEGPAIFRLTEHISRFFDSAAAINMVLPFRHEEIEAACIKIMQENKLNSAYIRPNAFFGYGNLGLTPRTCPVELLIGCWEWGRYLGEESLEKGVHALLLPWKRIHHSQLNASVKLGGIYVQSNIVASFARKHGFDEGIFLNLEGRIAEGPGENIIVIKNGKVKTNDKYESVLEGITRTTIMEIASDLGYATEIAPIELEELLEADELFFTGTAAEVTPITRVTDGQDKSLAKEDWKTYTVGDGKPGKISLQLANLYADIVRGKNSNYMHWLTPVNQEVKSTQTLDA